MYKFPMIFPVSASSPAGVSSLWTTTSSQKLSVDCSIPVEFNGPGGGSSPEDFYAMALANCFIATFKVFAQNSRLDFSRIDVRAELIVDRNEKGQPWMAKMMFQVSLQGAQQKDLALRVLEKTKNGCLILNSVQTEKVFEFQVS